MSRVFYFCIEPREWAILSLNEMELYPHNRQAYDRAREMLVERNYTCIIHPTGTGKAVIISKFIGDYPNKRHLVLAPSNLIFSEIRKHIHDERFDFMTYQSLADRLYDEVRSYDFIYLDEFHRIGATKWGKSVTALLGLNEGAKVIGTSATPIRYLDKARDMAAEIFDRSVASEISLCRAILEGILPTPRYVSAIYSISDEYSAVVKRIEESKHNDKRILARQLERNVIDWQKSSGIDIVLKKYLTPTRKKIIVFCSDFNHVVRAQGLLMPIFQQIYLEVEPFVVYSKYGRRKNNKTVSAFLSQGDVAKVVFTVDMLNEGLHSGDVSTVILFRETISPIIFYQQIGRCFSMDQKEKPLIFDLVNNCEAIKATPLTTDIELERQRIIQNRRISTGDISDDDLIVTGIEFIDETRELASLLEVFSSAVEHWEILFKRAEVFFQKNGHLVVTMAEPDLCKWIISQRQLRRRKALGRERIQKLTDIGIDWDYGDNFKWMHKYNELKTIVEANGGEPERWKDRKIGHWLWEQRQRHQQGKLPDNYIALLSRIVSMSKMREQAWDKKIAALKAHKQKNGDFVVSSDDAIYPVLVKVRKAFQHGKLPERILVMLADLDFPLVGKRTFATSFALVREYVEIHNSLPEITKDIVLTKWVWAQRHLLNKDGLRPEQVEQLASVGIFSSNHRNRQVEVSEFQTGAPEMGLDNIELNY